MTKYGKEESLRGKKGRMTKEVMKGRMTKERKEEWLWKERKKD